MSNLEIIKELYAAFAAGDMDRILELCDPDCVVLQDDALPWGGRYEGLDGVATFGLALGGTVDSVVTSDGLFEAGDRVIQFGRSRGTVVANGAVFDMPEVHVWTLCNGMVTTAEFYTDSLAMLDVLKRVS
jgi:ketosteroid isomerase-like protein